MKQVIVLTAAALVLAGCIDLPACSPESAAKAGERFSRCMQGDGEYRESSKECGGRAARFCESVNRKP